MAEEVRGPGRRRRLAAVLRTVPEETRAYKRLTPFLAPLLEWLEAGEAGREPV